jgi:hypothetical protein
MHPSPNEHHAVTGDTQKLDGDTPTEVFWASLNDAGIRIRPDFRRPTYWVAAVMMHQTDAFPTREEAALAAIRWLTHAYYKEQAAREKAESTLWWNRFF